MNSEWTTQILLAILAGWLVFRTVQRAKERKLVRETIKNVDLKSTQIIDVRSKQEFGGGSFPGSINIPLDQLLSKASDLELKDLILVCCASGSRSSIAKRLLQKKGATNVLNVGSWRSLR